MSGAQVQIVGPHLTSPHFSHTYRTTSGVLVAFVSCGQITLAFHDDPQLARDTAAACIEAAKTLEQAAAKAAFEAGAEDGQELLEREGQLLARDVPNWVPGHLQVVGE